MIIGIGTDLVKIDRLQKSIDRFGQRFLDKIFSKIEHDYCNNRSEIASCLAKRFAAKEAFVKALGTGMREGIWFRDVTVSNNSFGSPSILLSGEAAKRLENMQPYKIHLSLSDEGGFAQAFVIIEKAGNSTQ
ncbi:MAG: holo-ACP synthase [Magnetococcales bacterium]|nr:holo-ACP synthase [Magnetococcales bacterium]